MRHDLVVVKIAFLNEFCTTGIGQILCLEPFIFRNGNHIPKAAPVPRDRQHVGIDDRQDRLAQRRERYETAEPFEVLFRLHICFGEADHRLDRNIKQVFVKRGGRKRRTADRRRLHDGLFDIAFFAVHVQIRRDRLTTLTESEQRHLIPAGVSFDLLNERIKLTRQLQLSQTPVCHEHVNPAVCLHERLVFGA